MVASRRLVVLSAGVLFAALLPLSGCTDEPSPEPSPTPSTASTGPWPSPSPTTSASTPAPSASPRPSPTASVPTSFDDVASPSFPDLGGDLGGTGIVRVGRHTGYDRVVWEFTGTGPPTYRVRYVEQPLAEGSGDVVQVRGDAYLEVVITTVGIPDDGTARPPDASTASLAGTVIAEAGSIYGGFEGYGQTFVGVRDRQRPFSVSVLTDPTRLVIDIASG